jgi:hypothetical protein
MPAKREYLDLLVSGGSLWSSIVLKSYPLAKRARALLLRRPS